MTFRALALTFSFGALVPPFAAAATGPPLFRLAFASDTVIVEGLTLGGKVVWFGAAQSLAEDDVVEIRYYARIGQDTNLDGSESLALPAGVPTHGAFVAVDLTTGVATAAATPGYTLRQVPWRGRGVVDSGRGEDAIEDGRPLANVLVVRAGVGAWVARVSDGGANDDDGGVHGRWRLLLSSLQPLGDTIAGMPPRVLPTDTVAMIDPRRLELTLVARKPDTPLTAGEAAP